MKIRVKGGGDEKPAEQVPITNQHRKDWNAYIDYLRSKGLAGNAMLDKDGTGNKVLEQYIKDNPKTSLSVNIVKPLQGEFQNYKKWVIGEVKAGRASWGEGVNEDNVMDDLSGEDAYAGSKTASHKFPMQYLTIFDKPTNTTTTTNQGFATVK